MPDTSSLSPVAIHVHAIALAFAAALICWAALLAGLSRWHWFWRVGALCLPLLSLLPIRAYEPLVLLFPLLIALAGSAAALRTRWERELKLAAPRSGVANSRTKGSNRWSLSLADALLAMTVLGVILALLVQLPWQNLHLSWGGLLFDGALLLSVSLICLCLIGLRGGVLWSVALFFCVALGIVFESGYGDGLQALYLMGIAGPQHLHWAPLGEFFLTFLTLLLIGLWLIRWSWSAIEEPRLFAQRRRLVGSLAAVVAAPVLLLYMAMLIGPPPVPTPRIRNNSLPQLVEIAEQLQNLDVGDLTRHELAQETPVRQQAGEFAQLCEQSLEVVKQPGSVALGVGPQGREFSLAEQENQLLLLRSLARRWLREADHEFRVGNLYRAVEFDLATLRLGNYLARGGIRIHAQAAAAIKSEGLSHLSLLRHRLPADLIPLVLSVLETLDAGEEDPQLTSDRDRYWADIAFGWRNRLEIVVQNGLGVPTNDALALQTIKTPLARETAQRRLLGAEIALRQYHDEHGNYPATLHELVPTRLALLPRDPFTQQGLLYRRLQSGFVLYSTGPDALDNGGKFGRFSGESYYFAGQDWNLDSMNRFSRWHRWRAFSLNGNRL